MEESIPCIATVFFEGFGLFWHDAKKSNEAKRNSGLFMDR